MVYPFYKWNLTVGERIILAVFFFFMPEIMSQLVKLQPAMWASSKSQLLYSQSSSLQVT